MKGEMEMQPFYNQPTSHLQRILQNNHSLHDASFIHRESNPAFRDAFSRSNAHFSPASNTKDGAANDKGHKGSTNGLSDKKQVDADADSKNTSSETICYDDDDDDKNKNYDNNEEEDDDDDDEEEVNTVDEDDNDAKSSLTPNLQTNMQMMPNTNNISAINQPNVPNFNPQYNLHPNYYPPQHNLPFPQKRNFNGEPVMPSSYHPPPPNYPQPPQNYPQPPPHYQPTLTPSYLHPPRTHTPSMLDNTPNDFGLLVL